MSSVLIDTTADNYDFYPTPENLIDKMIEFADLKDGTVILEPSAGSGNIVTRLYEKAKKVQYQRYLYEVKIDVDCIEVDPRLQHILRGSGYRVIFDDFLRFHTFKKYDTIIMNPPFSNGDEHLLHALEMQKDGGKVICLLNAETIRNPYTNRRKVLLQQLNKYGAQIEYLLGAFEHAERKTAVEVALVYVNIPKPKRDSYFFNSLKKAKEEQEAKNAEPKEIVAGDYIQQAIDLYNFEVEATLNLIEEYQAMKPYILQDMSDDNPYNAPIVELTIDRSHNKLDRGLYMKRVRAKYWRALFSNKQFTENLTSNLQKQYQDMVSDMADYDFCLFNIKQVQEKMKSEMMQGLEETIMSLFDKLSSEHSWYPETKNNIHYYNGWATNQAHKINRKKVIIPVHGIFSSYSWEYGKIDEYRAYEVMVDIEKVFNYLSDDSYPYIDLRNAIKEAVAERRTKKIKLKYFTVTFYKKGTCHIEFDYPELVDKLNIYGAQNRNWLPPCYGKKAYEDLNEQEKSVIDEFQSEAEYREVCEKSEFYLNVGSDILLLGN